MRRIALIVLGVGAIATGVLLLGTGQAPATSHPTFDSSPPWDQYWTAEFVNGPLQLSSASGGTGTLVYTLEQSDGSDLPTGFVFDDTALTLSSTVEVVAGSHSLRYNVTDGQSSNAHNFRVEVAAALSVAEPANLRWSAGQLNTPVVLAAATGGTAPLTYSLRVDDGTADGADLPAGFVFDEDTRTLLGANPETSGIDVTRTLRYRVTDANGATDSQFFNVAVLVGGQSFGAQADLAWTASHVNTTVTLPSVTGGQAPLTYALALSDGSPRGTALPAGLEFDDTSRTLASTTALAPGSHTLRYTVDDSTGISVFQDFEVTVSAAPTVSAGDVEFTAEFANSVVLGEASGGSGTLVYSVRVDDGSSDGAALPSVLSFDDTSRTLSSTVGLTVSPASYSLFYRVTDANSAAASADFTITVSAAVSVPAVGDVEWTAGFESSVVLGEALGGSGTLVYSVRVDDGTSDGAVLPWWLFSFDASSRTLSSTRWLTASYSLFYRVTDANGASDTAEFTVTVNAAVSVSAGDVEFTAGLANSVVLGEALGGSGTLVYSVRVDDGTSDGAALPSVLSFDDTSRTLSSTVGLTVSPASYSLFYRATDANGASDTADFTVSVEAVSVSAVDVEFTAGFANSVVLGEALGGSGTLVYSVRVDDGTSDGAALPSVLSFDDTSRTLSSTVGLTVSPASYSLLYRVTDANSASDTAEFTITVNAAVSVSAGDVEFTAVFANSVVLGEALGGSGTLVYSVRVDDGTSDGAALPSVLSFDDTSRTLSSTVGLTVSPASYSLFYRATDANGASDTADFTVSVEAVSVSAVDVEFTAGFANSVVLGEALGGSGTLVYSVRVDDGTATGGDLPSVLSFDASSRTLSSTVDLAVSPASYSLLYKVTDANGASDTAEFTVMVNAAVSVPAVADVEFTAGFVNSVVLGEALGGSGTLVYSVRVDDGTATGGDLPLVLSFDASSRTLSSTVDLAVSPASYSLFYRATDANGASDTADFAVSVEAVSGVGW